MTNKLPGKCPVCGDDLKVIKLKCPSCQTGLSGNFHPGKFSKLDTDQLHFVEVFIKSRGNIKEVERELGISYPTVRNKLEEVIKIMGYNAKKSPEDNTTVRRKSILDALEKGEIDPMEAIKRLKNV
ncbi:MAG: DUF2089 domain-containing protein [Halanaerobiaceae bacterium]